jgi:hypothetical protein
MMFSLTNMSTTFQALMNDILRNVIQVFILVLFDDILIFSDSWSTHLQHVRTILCHLRKHGLGVKRSKCSFSASTVAYLGHVIFVDGVAMDADKVEVVHTGLTPRTVRAVRWFLGLMAYYQKFIHMYRDIAAPLT